MVIDSTPPLWVNALFPKQRLERVRNTRILHTTERDVRVKYSDNVLDTALLQREALWLSRVESLGVDTHQCLNFFKDGQRGLLKTTYLEGGSLTEFRKDSETWGNNDTRLNGIFSGLIDQVEQLHNVGVVHGDIKPSNVIISKTGKLSLIDFSNSRRVGELWSERGVSQSTQSYAYPRQDKSANPIHDYYSLLVTMLSLVGGTCDPIHTSFESWANLLLKQLGQLCIDDAFLEKMANVVILISNDLKTER